MDRGTQFTTELQALRVLCDETVSREDRQKLMEPMSHHSFTEPEYQVVFESVQALFSRGPFSLSQLRVHLNNRGFPDIDVEKYFESARPEDTESPSTDKITS